MVTLRRKTEDGTYNVRHKLPTRNTHPTNSIFTDGFGEEGHETVLNNDSTNTRDQNSTISRTDFH